MITQKIAELYSCTLAFHQAVRALKRVIQSVLYFSIIICFNVFLNCLILLHRLTSSHKLFNNLTSNGNTHAFSAV